MRTIAFVPMLLITGLLVGGAGAYITDRQMRGLPLVDIQRDPVLVATGPLDAPLVGQDGRLLGYVRFEAQLLVPAEAATRMRDNLPLLLDAINQRSFRAPIAGGADGLLPRLDPIRAIVARAARDSFADIPVQRVMVTSATPA